MKIIIAGKEKRGALSVKYFRRKNLVDTVVNKFGDAHEVEYYSKITFQLGLDYEEKIIDRHFFPGGMVLNVGCGAGREAIALAKKGYTVTGIDLQNKMIEQAKKNAEQLKASVDLRIMNACKLEFPDNSFDNVLAVGSVIAYIPRRKNRLQALRELKRVLKRGGKLIFSAPSKYRNLQHRIYFAVMDPLYRLLNVLHLSSFEPGDWLTNKNSGDQRISPGKSFIHMYSIAEATRDLMEAGYNLLECRSRKEITQSLEMPKQREKDYFIYYVAKKE